MYSYEDRIRAVELYIKLGKSVRPTIRQLGYPTKNSLKGWYNEYPQKLDLPAGYAGRRPKFSQEQKAAAIEHFSLRRRCLLARFNIPEPFGRLSSARPGGRILTHPEPRLLAGSNLPEQLPDGSQRDCGPCRDMSSSQAF